MVYGCILEILWDSLLSLHAMKNIISISLPLVVLPFWIASESGALPDKRCWISFSVYVAIGNSSSRILHCIRGSLFTAVSLSVDWRLSTLLYVRVYPQLKNESYFENVFCSLLGLLN